MAGHVIYASGIISRIELAMGYLCNAMNKELLCDSKSNYLRLHYFLGLDES